MTRNQINRVFADLMTAVRGLPCDCPDQRDFTAGEVEIEFNAGEEGLALDLLLDNLHDLKIPITGFVHNKLSLLRREFGLSTELLDQMVPDIEISIPPFPDEVK